MKFVIGMDGGGTSTKASLYPILEDGRLGQVQDSIIVGSSNVNSNAPQAILENFQTIWQALGSENVCAVCLGVAGISTPGAKEKLMSYLKTAGFPETVVLKGDHEIALRGAFDLDNGILLIAGTGAVAFGQTDSGQVFRAGGYGYLIDDEGSAFTIGLRMLKLWIQAYDKRIESSAMLDAMTGLFEEQLGSGKALAHVMDLAYHTPFVKSRIADLATLFSAYLAENDTYAIAIAKSQIDALIRLVLSVRDQIEESEVKLVFQGGVMQYNAYIREAVTSALQDYQRKIKVINTAADAEKGAAIFAKEAYLCKTC